MKRVLKAFAVAAAGLAVALLSPVHAWAACPGSVPFSECLAGGGIWVNPGVTDLGGTFWIVGTGDDAVGPGDTTGGFGNDAGQFALFPVPSDGASLGSWLIDFLGDNTTRCVYFDWASFGPDGCGDGATGGPAMAAVVRDDQNSFALMQTFPEAFQYDFDQINNGGAGPFGGPNNGVTLGRAVHVLSSSSNGGSATLSVAALDLTSGVTDYDDQGGLRPIPGTPQLVGVQGGSPAVVATASGGMVTVDSDTDLCWHLADGAYHPTLGCVHVGGLTPSQNITNPKAALDRGGAHFSWDVTAQFDVLGFNIYQANITKGTERKVNDTLIPISGENDAAAHSYSYDARRADLRAVRGGFDIELVRTNGQTLRVHAPVSR
jgi:hypothetical protein